MLLTKKQKQHQFSEDPRFLIRVIDAFNCFRHNDQRDGFGGSEEADVNIICVNIIICGSSRGGFCLKTSSDQDSLDHQVTQQESNISNYHIYQDDALNNIVTLNSAKCTYA